MILHIMICLKNGGILQNCCLNYYINRENDDSHQRILGYPIFRPTQRCVVHIFLDGLVHLL